MKIDWEWFGLIANLIGLLILLLILFSAGMMRM